MPPVGFEPTISAGEQLQTYALDRVATGTGTLVVNKRFDLYMSYAECMEKEKLQPPHSDVIASDTDTCMM